MLAGILIGVLGIRLDGQLERASARSAAQLFVRDLSLARASAVRTRESVVIRFHEPDSYYSISVVATGAELMRRNFAVNADIILSAIDLDMLGDSLVFNYRGFAVMSGASESLGTASFTAGTATYTVSFNTVGASRVEKS